MVFGRLSSVSIFFLKIGGSVLPGKNMKICNIFTFTIDIEKILDALDDIHQQILLAKNFHENLILPRELIQF